MDIALAVLHLLPHAEFAVEDGKITQWKPSEPIPSDAELAAAWQAIVAAEATEAHNAPILAQLAANDAERGIRAITDALAGDSRRLDLLRADQAALRAMLR